MCVPAVWFSFEKAWLLIMSTLLVPHKQKELIIEHWFKTLSKHNTESISIGDIISIIIEYGRIIFVYDSDFDENGIIHWIGSKNGTQKWLNPSKEGMVELTAKTKMYIPSYSIHDLIGRGDAYCAVDHNVDNWFKIDFTPIKIWIKPTHYTLRSGGSTAYKLESWDFDGSKNGKDWIK